MIRDNIATKVNTHDIYAVLDTGKSRYSENAKGLDVDAWGRPLIYSVYDSNSELTFSVRSTGRNGELNDDDDVEVLVRRLSNGKSQHRIYGPIQTMNSEDAY